MKTIIAGTRTSTVDQVLDAITKCPFKDEISEVSSGCNKSQVKNNKGEVVVVTGADYWGEVWAMNMDIPVKRFPADWKTHGKSAGPIRNSAMADYADAMILVWDGKSRGSADMLRKAKAKGLRCFVWNYAEGG